MTRYRILIETEAELVEGEPASAAEIIRAIEATFGGLDGGEHAVGDGTYDFDEGAVLRVWRARA